MTQERKAYNVVATADVNPEVVDSLGCTEWAGYDADEVDSALAEKDAEIRRLRRALWIARAKRAIDKIAWSTMNPEDGARQEFDKWKKALGKFLAKAEEYRTDRGKQGEGRKPARREVDPVHTDD